MSNDVSALRRACQRYGIEQIPYFWFDMEKGKWITITVDISNVGSNCTEFSLVMMNGTKLWLRDLAFTMEEPAEEEIVIDEFEMEEPVEDEPAEEADDSQDPTDDKEDNQKANKEDELAERREKYAKYRKEGMDVKSAGTAVGVSFTTAKRYEKWYQSNRA